MEQSLESVASDRGLTLKELARLTGIPDVYIWKFANRRGVPKLPDACAIADALDISWKDVITLCQERK